MNNDIGWGLIGASNVAREWVIPAIRSVQGSPPVAVLGSDPGRIREYAAANGVAKAYDRLDEFLADPDIQAVYVSNTNEKHASATIAAARAGKHVLCEKPMAMSIEDARAMLQAAREAGVQLGVNHHLRCMETHRTMARLIREGAIGRPVFARLFFGVTLPEEAKRWRAGDAKAGGGVLFDLTVHDADLVRFLLGENAVEVAALTGVTGVTRGGLPDTALIAARMESGLLVQIGESFSIAHADTSLEIHGTDGALLADDVLMQRGGGRVTLRRGTRSEELPISHENAYPRMVAQFCAAIRGEGRPFVTGEDGFESLAFALAAREAAETGRVVKVERAQAA